MGPTENLPGQDGMMVSPTVLSLVWHTTPGSAELHWAFAHVRTDVGRALCFRCITTKVPADRRPLLADVYEAVVLETRADEIELSQCGRLVAAEERGAVVAATNQLLEKLNQMDHEVCLLCGTKVHSANKPFFVAKNFARTYCRQHPSGVLFGESNYSISNLRYGCVAFMLCFQCVRCNFPQLTKCIECDLMGKEIPKQPAEFLITQQAMEALQQELGAAEANRRLKDLGAKIVGPDQN